MRDLGFGRVAALAVVSVCVLSACSDDGPTLDDHEQISKLDDSERGALCDWWAQQWGGYGTTIMCGAAPYPNWTSQAECKSFKRDLFESCTQGTVGQFKACQRAADKNRCPYLEGSFFPDECDAFDRACKL